MSHAIYDMDFYRRQQEGSARSARVVVPLILEAVRPQSVIDIGCGVGTWLSVFMEQGVTDGLGFDGTYVDPDMLFIPRERFRPTDLSEPFAAERGFDLAMSLEVAEHIAPDRAGRFIDCLTRLAPVVVFSAAIPSQLGDGHVNEQWPSYWLPHFQRNGFVPVDWLRRRIWSVPDVEWWYAQNLLIYVRADALPGHPLLAAEPPLRHPADLDVVHPRMLTNLLRVFRNNPRLVTGEDAQDAPSPPPVPLDARAGALLPAGLPDPVLRQERHDLAHAILALKPEGLATFAEGPLFAPYRAAQETHLRHEPLSAAEAAVLEEIAPILTSGGERTLNAYLVALLYRPAFQLPSLIRLDRAPSALMSSLMEWLLQRPEMVMEAGDSERYATFMEALAFEVMRLAEAGHPAAGAALEGYAVRANFIPLYFNSSNLKGVYARRGRIIETFLRRRGLPLDWSFAPRDRNRRIRVGVLAMQFIPHTETFTTIPCYKELDRNRFEVVLFALQQTGSEMETACAASAAAMVFLPAKLSEAASEIRQRDLDILLFGTNVGAVTNTMTLLASHRLARVQVTAFSSPATTGLSAMDRYLSGDLSEGEDGGQSQYNERLSLLSGTGFCFDYHTLPAAVVEPVTRDALELGADTVVFASGANLYKISAETRALWAEILAKVPNSVLVLYPFGPAWTNSYPEQRFRRVMREALDGQGVASDRLRLLTKLDNRSMVKAVLANVDVYLDSVPYSGANSNVDPLEMGIPVVAMQGTTLRTRQGAAMLLDLDLAELVAGDRGAYVDLAVRLGGDPDFRQVMRNRVADRMRSGPRFLDTRDYARQLERCFVDMLGE